MVTQVVPLGALTPNQFSGDVQLENVAFSYPGRPNAIVLNGVSLHVQPGEVSGVPICRAPCQRTKSASG